MDFRYILNISVLLVLSLHLGTVNAQEVGMPSPTAANLGKVADQGVNYFNGKPNIGLPIFSIGDGQLNLSVNLSYDATGVRVSEVPDWVGTGWALNAGGVITRSVKGTPDDDVSNGYFYNDSLMNFMKNIYADEVITTAEYASQHAGKSMQDHLIDMKNGNTDSEMDVFYYNFDGQSGKFVLGFQGGEPVTIPQSDLKIEFFTSSVTGVSSISKFVLTAPNGMKYTFDEVEYSISQPGTSSSNFSYSTAWFLTKVESPVSDDVITLNYQTTHTTVHKYNNEEYELSGTPTADRYSYQKFNRTNLKEIIFKDQKLSFLRELRTDAKTPSDWTPANTQQEYRLTSVEKFIGNTKVREFDFSYSYPGGRLFLDQVQEKGMNGEVLPPTKFTYHNATSLPDRLDTGIDHWGFFNGKGSYNTSAKGFIQKGEWYDIMAGEYKLHDGADRSVDTAKVKYGILTKIEYPTGGSIEYEYESNDYSHIIYPNKTNGGLVSNNISVASGNLSTISGIEQESFADDDAEEIEVTVTMYYNCNGTYLDLDRLYLSDESNPLLNGWHENRGWIDIDHTTNNNTTCSQFTSNYGSGGPGGVQFQKVIDLNINYESGNTFDFTFDTNLPQQYHEDDDTATLTYSVSGVDKVFPGGVKTNGPGLRVKKTTMNSGDSSIPAIIKNYEYNDSSDSTKSSGVMYNEPIYARFYPNELYPESRGAARTWLTISQQTSFGMGASGFAGYESVEEIITNNGKTEIQFYSIGDKTAKLLESLNDFIDFYSLNTSANPNVILSPYMGKPRVNKVYNESSDVLTENIFTENQTDYSLSHPTKDYFGISTDRKVFGASSLPSALPYYMKIPFLANTKTVSKVYNGSGNGLTTTVEVEYDSTSLNPKKVIKTNSDSSKIITKYAYAFEKYGSPFIDGNMLTQMYAVTTENESGDVLSKNWTVWYNTGGGRYNVLSQWQWEGSGPTDTNAAYDPDTEAFKASQVNHYNSKGRPLEVEDATGLKTSYDWSEDGSNPIGIFQNADKDNVYAHSFALDSLDGWTFTDVGSDGDTEVSIDEGKLKLKNFASASNGEVDRIYYDHGSEITENLIWEFDVKIADTDSWDLTIAAGGSSWDRGLGTTERAVWTSINKKSWRYFDTTSGSVIIKSGLEVGETYQFKIVMKSGLEKVDYYVNGEKLISNADFRFTSSGIQHFAFGNYGYGSTTTEWFIDNVRMYPEGAQAANQEVEPLFRNPLAMKGTSGTTKRYEYDDLGRLIKSYNTNGELVSSNIYYYSLDNNSNYSSSDPNRVENWKYYDPNNSSNVTKSVSYMDGLGRGIQTQVRGGSTTMISDTRFNDRGLPEVTSRPYQITNQTTFKQYGFEGDSMGTFVVGSALPSNSPIEDEYQSLPSDDEDYAYTQVQYEASPLARTKKSTLPGPSHKIGSGNEKEVSYGLNTTESFTINGKTWEINKLSKTVSRDPEGNETITYTDGWGRTIVSGVNMNPSSDDVLNKSSSDLVTYFEYDIRGNLVRVEDPRGLVTSYTYNQKGELISRKLPDQENSLDYKYDKKGRLRFVHDPNHKSNENDFSQNLSGGTTVTKTITTTSDGVLDLYFYIFDLYNDDYNYKIEHVDNGNAVLYSGSFSSDDDVTHSLVVGPGVYKFTGESVDPGEPIVGSNGTFSFTSYDIYTYTKYDELDRPIETGEYAGSTSFSSANPDTDTFPTSGNDANIQYYYDGNQAYSGSLIPKNMKGKLSKVSYRDLSTTSDWGYTYYSYNTLGLVEWMVQDLPGLSEKVVEYSYDELGRLTQMDYQADSTDAFYQRYTYDALGRMTKVETSTNGSTWVKDAEYTSFFADGQVGQMKLGNSAIQTVDYTYTVQGWLDKINDPSSIGNDKFAMDLSYNLNGSISQQDWRQPQLNANIATYSYSYDNANRMTAANFSGTGYSSSALDVSGITYDKNGGIKTMFRNNNSGSLITELEIGIESGSNRISEMLDYVEQAVQGVSYDANGNMTSNDLQGFSSVDYDWRNLPAQMIVGSSTLQYAYDAEGNRIKKKVVSGTETHYVRGVGGETIAMYENGSVVSHNILAGADIVGSWDGTERRYFLKDHIGSVRTTIDQSGNIDGYDDYYPFGLTMPGRSSNSANPNDNYKFTGHVRDNEASLTLDYMMARNYDPIIGRFLQIDPMTAKFSALSPYNYVANNPLIATDPDGRDFTIDITRNEDGEITGVTFNANIYVADEKERKVVQKAANQWNKRTGSTEIGNLIQRIFSNDTKIDVSMNVNVIISENPELSANHDNAGNAFYLESEDDFEDLFIKLEGQGKANLAGGLTWNQYSISVPEYRDGEDANLTGRIAHEIGHLFGLSDPVGRNPGSGVMGYPIGDNPSEFEQIPNISPLDVKKVGKKWRRQIRRNGGAKKIIYKEGTITKE